MSTISYAVTVCNEDKELNFLLTQLTSAFNYADEIVIVTDDGNTTPEVEAVISAFIDLFPGQVRSHPHKLNKDFASHKNFLKSRCTKDYIVFIDADETLHENLAATLSQIIDMNAGKVDMIAVPRVNTVSGLTQEHITKWGWRVNEKGWVNFPDFQLRICANKPEIVWEGKVHERLVGWKTSSNLPFTDENWALLHPKNIERQEKQNNFYEQI
jgi:glycosyltransferase involved in cell wall biosynthesis